MQQGWMHQEVNLTTIVLTKPEFPLHSKKLITKYIKLFNISGIWIYPKICPQVSLILNISSKGYTLFYVFLKMVNSVMIYWAPHTYFLILFPKIHEGISVFYPAVLHHYLAPAMTSVKHGESFSIVELFNLFVLWDFTETYRPILRKTYLKQNVHGL